MPTWTRNRGYFTIPKPHQGLPLTHSALLSLVRSLKHGSGWKTIRPAALATMLFIEVFSGRGFMPVFKLTEEMTAENRISKGYVGISLGLLRKLTQYELLTIKGMGGKTNSKGESLLRYYEPDHERLRKGAWVAA